MNRTEQTISERVVKLMIDQISRELYNHNVYRSFANFYYKSGLVKLYEYYRHRADEEYNHHSWIVDRLSQSGVDFSYPEVKVVKEIVLKPEDSFPLTVSLEIETTGWINKIVKACIEEEDYINEQWLKDIMLGEQMNFCLKTW